MARPETLIPGNCYFSVGFYDNDLVLPMIDTLVYVGQETDQDEGRWWLFKEPECDRGRTRVLQFPIPSERDSIVALCKRVFMELHSMRRGDVLDYHFLRKSDVNVGQ